MKEKVRTRKQALREGSSLQDAQVYSKHSMNWLSDLHHQGRDDIVIAISVTADHIKLPKSGVTFFK